MLKELLAIIFDNFKVRDIFMTMGELIYEKESTGSCERVTSDELFTAIANFLAHKRGKEARTEVNKREL